MVNFFEQVYLLSTGGHIFSSSFHSKNYEMVQALLDDEELMGRIEENGGKSVMLVLSDGTSNKLCMAKTIKNVYGNFKTVGTAVVLLKDRNMPELLDSYPYSEDLTLYIVNPYLQVTFQKNVTPFLERNLEQRALYSQLPGKSGSANLKIGGRNYWTFYDTGDYSHWKYIEMWDEQKLLSQVIEIKDYFLFVVLLSLLFFWLVIFLTARSISRPIQTLVRSMERMKAGDLNSPVSVSSEGEIGVLSRTFNEMQGEIKALIGNIQAISNREKEMEINYLKTQINPHFLYNVLGSVNWMAARKNQPEICDAITDLSDLLRYCLDKNTGDIVTVQEDVAWLEKYIALQRMRYTGGFHVIINVDPMVQGKRIHKLMLQPLLENSLMHGGCGAAADALIVIFIQGKPEGIYFELSDNGTGMTPQQAEQVLAGGSGMGIKNVNERLKLYYGEEYGLKISTCPGQGTTVSFTMPYLD